MVEKIDNDILRVSLASRIYGISYDTVLVFYNKYNGDEAGFHGALEEKLDRLKTIDHLKNISRNRNAMKKLKILNVEKASFTTLSLMGENIVFEAYELPEGLTNDTRHEYVLVEVLHLTDNPKIFNTTYKVIKENKDDI